MPFLSDLCDVHHRRMEPEIMDDPRLDPREHASALRGLARINALSGSARILWSPIRALALARPARPLRVLDIATGSADIPIRLLKHARRAGIPVEISACDRSEEAVRLARQRAERAGVPIQVFPLDVFRDPIPTDFDVLTSSLFLHHLTCDEAVTFLERTSRATGALLVQDLLRSRAGLVLTWLGTRTLTRSHVVHVDGIRSLRAAYTLSEARQLAVRAGLHGAVMGRHWPLRFLMTWRRP